MKLTDPMETTRQEEQGRMELRLVDTEDPDRRVTLAFGDPTKALELGRALVDAALNMQMRRRQRSYAARIKAAGVHLLREKRRGDDGSEGENH